jgi:hypothetical protein
VSKRPPNPSNPPTSPLLPMAPGKLYSGHPPAFKQLDEPRLASKPIVDQQNRNSVLMPPTTRQPFTSNIPSVKDELTLLDDNSHV